jgi:transitional endoplasmic reticulum ATPase
MKEKLVELQVAEAYARDAGRGIARIDMEPMKELEVVSGDVIEIEGKDIATAIVWMGYEADSNKRIIRIDGNIRSNVGVTMDNKVKVRKTRAKEAKRITLESTQPVKITGVEKYFLNLLKGRPITKGQIIKVEMLGDPISFVVAKTNPTGTVIPQIDTEIKIKASTEEIGVLHATYEDIGGLKQEIEMLKEIIELSLMHPDLSNLMGIDPPKRVLLYGPSGTGKTLIVNAVINESDANIYFVSGPEMVSKFYGESEKHLREIFEEAGKNAPSIIFITELDSIAPKRGDTTGETERRMVAQLLSLMDGEELREKEVIFIGETNKIDALDGVLRSKFDREIEIGIPDEKGRQEILKIHTRRMPIAEGVDINEIACDTEEFTGADLKKLCQEAAMHALRRILPEIDIEEATPSEMMGELEVRKEDFKEALKFILK